MVGPSHLKPPSPLHVFFYSMKPSSSTLASMRLKTLIHTVIFSNLCRITRALSKAKSVVIELVKDTQFVHFKKKCNKKKRFGSFRLQYNWSSSHVMPVSDDISTAHFYYDSTWSTTVVSSTNECIQGSESQLSRYLHWLEEKGSESSRFEQDINEIDRLADKFIASCREKFKLEKQESDRRYQDMMARSI